MRRRRPSAVVTVIALMTALAVAIPSAHAAGRQGARQKPSDRAKKKKGGSGERLRGPGHQAGHAPGTGSHAIGAGSSNVFGRRGPTAGAGSTQRRAGGTRVATASTRSSAAGKARKSAAKKTTKRKTAKRPVRNTRTRVKPRAAAAQAAEQQAAGGGAEAADFDPRAQGFDPGGYEAGEEGYAGDDGFDGGEQPRRGIGSGVKKAFKVLGMGVLAVGIGAVFIAGGAPLLSLSVPVMMFAIGAGQIIAKPEIDPNQMVLPQDGQDLGGNDGLTPQQRYQFLSRDYAAGGNLPGGLPSRNGLTPPAAPNFGDNNGFGN